jgi:glycosyltransferase involved in cell wall biosynthesis
LYDGLIPPFVTIETISNGINTARFQRQSTVRQNLRLQLGFDEDAFVVIFCGRLDTNKRPLFALNMFAEFLASQPQGRLLVVGDGPEMAALKAGIDALKLQDKVILTGQVADTAPYYSASDCYLSTSALEGCPLAAAEALASGIPAVVPDDDVFRSVYGACTAVQRCNPADPTDWCQALLAIARQDAAARQALGQSAMTFAQKELSESVMNQKLTQFYENIASKLNR